MFEGLVANLLNKHLGEFLEGLDKKQLSLSVTSGKVHLTNLKVKSTCLDVLNLPIAVKSGSVGKLYLTADWRKLGSKPVQAELHDVVLVVKRKQASDVALDATAVRDKAVNDKLNKLKTWETAKIAQEEVKDDKKQKQKKDSFAEKLASKIVDNLQISVKRLHVRFEDEFEGKPIAFGLGLEELSGVTTDADGEQAFIVGAKRVYKTVTLRSLFVYLDVYGNRKPPTTSVFDHETQKHMQFLLRPLSGKLKLQLNKDMLPGPLVLVDACLESLGVQLAREQFLAALNVAQQLEQSALSVQKRLRALVPAELDMDSKTRASYIALYKRTFAKQKKLSTKELEQKESLEKLFIFDDLVMCRTCAMAELKHAHKGTLPKLQGAKSSWFSGWGKSKSSETLTEEQKAQLYKEIEYSPDEQQDTKLPAAWVQLEAAVTIQSFNVSLLGSEGDTLVQLHAQQMKAHVWTRQAGLRAAVSLLSIEMRDYSTDDTRWPYLIQSLDTSEEHQDTLKLVAATPVVACEVDLQPVSGIADVVLKLRLTSQQIVLHPPLLALVSGFFAVAPKTASAQDGAPDLSLRKNSPAALKRNEALRQATQKALKQYTALQLAIDLHAPTILVVPEPTRADGDVLVVDLGSFSLHSRQQDKSRVATALDLLQTRGIYDSVTPPAASLLSSTERAELYDSLQLRLKQTQIYFSTEDRWRSSEGRQYLLQPINFEANIGLSVAPSVLWLPTIHMASSVPPVTVDISESSYGKIMYLASKLVPALPPPPPKSRIEGEGGEEVDPAWMSCKEVSTMFGGETRAKEVLAEADADLALSSKKTTSDQTSLIQAWQRGQIPRATVLDWWSKRDDQRQRQHDSTLRLEVTLEAVRFRLGWAGADGGERPVVEVALEGLGFDLGITGYVQKIGCSLDSIAVVNKLSRNESWFVRTQTQGDGQGGGQDRFVTVQFVIQSPLAYTYGSNPTAAQLDVAVGCVTVEIDPRPVEKLVNFFTTTFLPAGEQHLEDLTASVETTDEQGADTGTDRALPAPPGSSPKARRRSLTRAVVATEKRGKDHRKARIEFKLKATFQSLVVLLSVDRAPLAKLAVTGLSAQFVQFARSMSLVCGLDVLSVCDLSPRGKKYTNIVEQLQVSDAPMISVSFDTFHEAEQEFDGWPAQLAVGVQGIRVRYLARFVQELALFFTTGAIARLTLSQTSTDAASKLASSAAAAAADLADLPGSSLDQGPQAGSGLTKIDITVADIALAVPIASESDDTLSAVLQSIHVFNRQDTLDTGLKYQRFLVELSAFAMDSTQQTCREEDVKDGCTYPLTRRLLEVGSADQPGGKGVAISVDCALLAKRTSVAVVLAQGVKLQASHGQFVLIMALLQGNLTEQPTIVSASDRRREQRRQRHRIEDDTDQSERGKARRARREKRREQERALANRPKPEMEVNVEVKVPQVSLTLSKEQGQREGDGLLHGTLDDFSFTMKQSSNGEMVGRLVLVSVLVTDISEDTLPQLESPKSSQSKRVLPAYRKVLRSVREQNVLTVHLKVEPPEEEGRQTSLVSVEGVVQGMQVAVAKVLLLLPPWLDHGLGPAVDAREGGGVDLPKAAQPNMSMVFKLRDLSVVLPADPTRVSAPGLLLRLGVAAHVEVNAATGTSNVQLNVSDLQLQHTDLVVKDDLVGFGDDANSSVVLAPFFVFVRLTASKSVLVPGQMALAVTVDVGGLTAQITYTEYRTLLAALQHLSAVTDQAEPDAKALRRGSLRAEVDVDVADASQEMKRLVQQLSFGEQDIQVSVEQVSVMLINDALTEQAPVARLNLSPIGVQLHSVGHESVLIVSVDVKSHFFNNALVTWEPLLEPASLRCAITRRLRLQPVDMLPTRVKSRSFMSKSSSMALTDTENPTSPTAASQADSEERDPYAVMAARMAELTTCIDVTCSSGLDVVVSRGMLESVLHAVALLTLVDKATSSSVKLAADYDPYALSNQTELELVVTLLDDKKGKSDPVLKVAGGSRTGFSFAEGNAQVRRRVSVGFAAHPTWEPVTISLSSTASWTLRCFDVPEKLGGGIARVVFRLEMTRGTKVLVVRSAVAIENHFSVAVKLTLTPQNSSTPLAITLAPSPEALQASEHAWLPTSSSTATSSPSKYWLPVLAAAHPSISMGGGEGNSLTLTCCPAAPEMTRITCCAGENGESLMVAVEADDEAEAGESRVYGLWPLIVVESQLNCPLAVRLLSSSSSASHGETEIVPMSSSSLASSNGSGNMVSFRLPSLQGCLWSHPIRLPAPSALEARGATSKATSVQVPCTAGEYRLSVGWSLEHGTAIRATVFVPLWIYDLTGLGLVASWDRIRAASAPPSAVVPDRGQLATPGDGGEEEERVCALMVPPAPNGTDLKLYLQTAASVDTEWAKGVKLSSLALGDTGAVSIPSAAGPLHLSLRVHVDTATLLPNTKVITISAVVCVLNRLPFPVMVRQPSTGEHTAVQVPSAQARPVYLLPIDPEVITSSPRTKRRSIKKGSQKGSRKKKKAPPSKQDKKRKIPEQWGRLLQLLPLTNGPDAVSGWRWSGCFAPAREGSQRLLVAHGNDPSRSFFARVDVVPKGSCFVAVLQELGKPSRPTGQLRSEVQLTWKLPYRIENRTSKVLYFRQSACRLSALIWGGTAPEGLWRSLEPSACSPYAWEQPLGEPRQLEMVLGDVVSPVARLTVDLTAETALHPFQCKKGIKATVARLTDAGSCRVISISDTLQGHGSSVQSLLASDANDRKVLALSGARRQAEMTLGPWSEVSFRLLAAPGLLDLPFDGGNIEDARVVVVLSIPSIEFRAGFVVYDGTSANLSVQLMQRHRQNQCQEAILRKGPCIPAGLHGVFHASDLINNDMLKRLAPSLVQGEVVLYLTTNSSTTMVENAVFITDRRLVKREKGVIVLEVPLCDILLTGRWKAPPTKWDMLVTLSHDGTVKCFGIFSRKACKFLLAVVTSILHPRDVALGRVMAGAAFDKAVKTGVGGKEPGIPGLQMAVRETLHKWDHTIKVIISDRLLAGETPLAMSCELFVLPSGLPKPAPSLLLQTSIALTNLTKREALSPAADDSMPDWDCRKVPLGKSASLLLAVRHVDASSYEKRALMTLRAKISRVGLSVIDGAPEELLYVSAHDLCVGVEVSQEEHAAELVLDQLQIDDQRPGAQFPVVLAATPVAERERQPLLKVSFNKDAEHTGVLHMRYATVLLQRLDLKIDEAFINLLLDMVSALQEAYLNATQQNTDKGRLDVLATPVNQFKTLGVAQSEQQIFFGLLHIQPVACYLWLRPVSGGDAAVNPLRALVRGLGSTLGNIDQANIQLSGKLFNDYTGTTDTLASSLQQAYTKKALSQVLPLLGSFEFLGNPVGMVTSLGTGVTDFFYEPAKGFVTSPKAFSKGLAKGSASLVSNTLSGVLGAAGKITGSVSRGLAQLTMDDEYVAERNKTAKPTNAADGFSKGLKSFGSSMFGAVTGVVTKPMDGLKEGGALGLGKGVAQGLGGLIFKPVSGVVDLASHTISGVAQTPDFLLKAGLSNYQVRPQRALEPDNPISEYQLVAAINQLVNRNRTGITKPKYVRTGDELEQRGLAQQLRKRFSLQSGERLLSLCSNGTHYGGDETANCIVLTSERFAWIVPGTVNDFELTELARVEVKHTGPLHHDRLIFLLNNGSPLEVKFADDSVCAYYAARLQQRIRSRFGGNSHAVVRKRLNVPKAVLHGTALRNLQVDKYLSTKKGFSLNKEEQVQYLANNRVLGDDITWTCLLLTNQRVIKFKDGACTLILPRASIHHCEHQRGGMGRWHSIIATLNDGKKVKAAVWSGEACGFFVDLLNAAPK